MCDYMAPSKRCLEIVKRECVHLIRDPASIPPSECASAVHIGLLTVVARAPGGAETGADTHIDPNLPLYCSICRNGRSKACMAELRRYTQLSCELGALGRQRAMLLLLLRPDAENRPEEEPLHPRVQPRQC
jgi:hypothetical protein